MANNVRESKDAIEFPLCIYLLLNMPLGNIPFNVAIMGFSCLDIHLIIHNVIFCEDRALGSKKRQHCSSKSKDDTCFSCENYIDG